MSSFIVRERNDGRGGIRPFNHYTPRMKGSIVKIGTREYKVTSDGRVNIPASLMKQYGIKGDDGRLRIGILFKSEEGTKGRYVYAQIMKPDESVKNYEQGRVIPKPYITSNRLRPSDAPDYNWSPV